MRRVSHYETVHPTGFHLALAPDKLLSKRRWVILYEWLKTTLVISESTHLALRGIIRGKHRNAGLGHRVATRPSLFFSPHGGHGCHRVLRGRRSLLASKPATSPFDEPHDDSPFASKTPSGTNLLDSLEAELDLPQGLEICVIDSELEPRGGDDRDEHGRDAEQHEGRKHA